MTCKVIFGKVHRFDYAILEDLMGLRRQIKRIKLSYWQLAELGRPQGATEVWYNAVNNCKLMMNPV